MQMNVHMSKGDKQTRMYVPLRPRDGALLFPPEPIWSLMQRSQVSCLHGPSNKELSVNLVYFPEGCLTMT